VTVVVRPAAKELPDFETVLITRILETGDIRTAIRRKVTEDFFFLPDNRAAFTYLLNHYHEYGTVPSVPLFVQDFPDFDLHTTSDNVASICDHLRDLKLHRDLMKGMEEAVRHTRQDAQEGLRSVRALVASLTSQYVLTRDVDLTKATAETRAEYERVKAGHGLLGIQWPWEKMNETTLGIQNEELVFFYARPKSLKTWLMLATALHAFKKGRKVLFITMEMPVDQIRRRAACIWSGLDYEAVRAGHLTAAEERQYFEDLEAFAEMPSFILSGGDDHGLGVLTLGAKIQEYDPDIVFVDSVYLMHDDRQAKRSSDWQSISHITQDLKSLTKRTMLPIVGSTQSNRSGERTKGSTLAELAYGDSFGQDADYVIRIIYDKKEKDNKEAIITIPGIREAPGCTFTINAMVAQDLSQKFVCNSEAEVDEILSGTDDSGVIR
jgi:replicative DNA helicase